MVSSGILWKCTKLRPIVKMVRIRGITVEIGGDTTKLQTALKGVNTEIKNTQSQLKEFLFFVDKRI